MVLATYFLKFYFILFIYSVSDVQTSAHQK